MMSVLQFSIHWSLHLVIEDATTQIYFLKDLLQFKTTNLCLLLVF